MLTSISELSHEDAADVLDRAIESLLPSPFDEGLHTNSTQAAVVTELRTRLKLANDDLSLRARQMLLDALTEELRTLLLVREAEADARARLAAQNQLPPAAFSVVFPKGFEETFEPLGVDRAHVMSALRRPDAYEFDPIPAMRGETGVGLLLVTKTLGSSKDPFTLLLVARRSGGELGMQAAWRIYHNDVDLSDTRSPLAALRKFAEVFGVPFYTPTSPSPVKFVESDVINNLSGAEPPIYADFLSPPEKVMLMQTMRKTAIISIWIVCAVYAVDIRRYIAAMNRHGVRAHLRG